MSEAIELQRHEPQAVALRDSAPNIGEMLKAVIDKGITGENVGALDKLLGVYERMEDRDSERAFATDFTALQSEVPKIQANKTVANKDGTPRFAYADYEEIDDQLRPIALRYGFTWSFMEGPQVAGKVTKICVVQHRRGHSREHSHTVRIGSGPPGCSDSQVDESAHSYAKRGALCDAFCIRVRHTGDARDEGGSISAEQAADLEKRVKETGSDMRRFLSFAGAKSFAEISTIRYAMLDENLRRKEKTT